MVMASYLIDLKIPYKLEKTRASLTEKLIWLENMMVESRTEPRCSEVLPKGRSIDDQDYRNRRHLTARKTHCQRHTTRSTNHGSSLCTNRDFRHIQHQKPDVRSPELSVSDNVSNRTTENGQRAVQVRVSLVEQLAYLKNTLKAGYELDVNWLPGENEKLHGEVKGNSICIYDEDEEEALQTLKHEFIDYLVSGAIKPYERLANLLISLFNEEAYAKKEKLVEALCRLI